MLASDVPVPLAERLGTEGTNGLLEILERTREESVAVAMTACADRFERRLVETSSGLRLEMAGLRQEMHDGFAAVRHEMCGGLAAVRHEMYGGLAAVRQEMRDGFAVLRLEMHGEVTDLRQRMDGRFGAVGQEMHGGFAALRQEIAAVRQEAATRHADLLKWSFLFSVGQVAVVAGLFGVLLRAIR